MLQIRKNMVGGRYLATFSSNSFGISRNQVAELVAAAVLVATFRATPRNCFNHEGHEGEEKQALAPGSWPLAKNLRDPLREDGQTPPAA